MMEFVMRLVGFDRETDRLTVEHVVPAEFVQDAMRTAGITDADLQMGDIPLSAEAARKIAAKIDARIDTRGSEFFLEASAPEDTRRRA